MSGAEGVLAVNVAVAGLFAAGYLIFAMVNRSQRAAVWFSGGYLVGMLSPLSELLGPALGAPLVTEWASYITFLLATLSIGVTFPLYHDRRPQWLPMLAILAVGVALRAGIGMAPRDGLDYGMAYQLPFTLGAIQAVNVVLSIDRRRPLHMMLAGVFAVIALNLLTKPFLAQAFGTGGTLEGYTRTTYALLSQASTGILLLAAGVMLLLIVAQRAITESQAASEIDPLSGAANRRGFDRLAQEVLARAGQSGAPVAVAVFDLDHFKRINDSFGHAAGDAVIAAFAARLRGVTAAAAVGRMGGEEFAMLFEGVGVEGAWRCAETLRRETRAGSDDGLPAFTVSGGVAELRPRESFAELMRRADAASYEAKTGGRDRICRAAEDWRQAPVVQLHGHQAAQRR